MTDEVAINKLVNARYSDEFQGDEELTTAHLLAIKALEQKPDLSKIRAEIKELYRDRPNSYNHPQRTEFYSGVLAIIDKYKAESNNEMLVCPACGLDVHSHFKTCPRCGVKMESEDKQ